MAQFMSAIGARALAEESDVFPARFASRLRHKQSDTCHVYAAIVMYISVSQTGLRRGVSGIPRDENA
jgi:hypothetical protein